MSVTTWEERLTSGDISSLYFRNEVSHVLRAQPQVASQRRRWIPADPGAYHLEPLEIRGDWMRVRFIQPSDYCVGPDGPPSSRDEGWVM